MSDKLRDALNRAAGYDNVPQHPNWADNPTVAETDYAIMRKLNADNVELRAENAMLRQDVISLAKGYEDRIIELRAREDRWRNVLYETLEAWSAEVNRLLDGNVRPT